MLKLLCEMSVVIISIFLMTKLRLKKLINLLRVIQGQIAEAAFKSISPRPRSPCFQQFAIVGETELELRFCD